MGSMMRLRRRLAGSGVAAIIGLLLVGCQPTMATRPLRANAAARSSSIRAQSRPTAVQQELVRQLKQVEVQILTAPERAARDELLAKRLALVVALRNLSAAEGDLVQTTATKAAQLAQPQHQAGALVELARQQIMHERMVVAQRRAKEKQKAEEERRYLRTRSFHFEEKKAPASKLAGRDKMDFMTEPIEPVDSPPPVLDPEARKPPAAARVRYVAPPSGVLRAVGSRVAQLSACMPASAGDSPSLRLTARIDEQGALRDPRFSGASLDPQTSGCLGDVLRSVRVSDHQGGSRVFSVQLYLGSP